MHRTKDERLRSEAGRRIAAYGSNKPDWMQGSRSLPRLEPPPSLDAHTRLSSYFKLLGDMPSMIHTCENCLQKGIDHDIDQDPLAALPSKQHCWFCKRNPRALHWSNGLDLDLNPGNLSEPETDENRRSLVPQAARQEWRDLNVWLAGGWQTDSSPEGHALRAAVAAEPRFKWVPELTPIEEALISRVSCCTSVLCLPCDAQLGYRGNVINFINELGVVQRQLPCRPEQSGVTLVYRVDGQNKGCSQNKVVRRMVISKFLQFFAAHHNVYKYGIRNQYGTVGAEDEYACHGPKAQFTQLHSDAAWFYV
jgi:hypothetical protein